MILSECPVCKSNKISFRIVAEDHLVSHEKFNIYECQSCQLRFTNPPPEANHLDKYYESEEYISHTDKGSSIINSLYKVARKFTLAKKRKLLESLSTGRTLLDFGCGTGHFLKHFQHHGWQVWGIERNEMARQKAEASGLTHIYQNIDKAEHNSYDVITLWHVLEHIPDLDQILIQLSALLSEEGKLIIAVPNYEAYEAMQFNEFWAGYDVPRHLYHFSRKSMQVLLANHGLKIVKTYPMLLDSFYISLLSNKYKYGRSRYVSSVITGLLSNVYALKTDNYSSIIYQISKA